MKHILTEKEIKKMYNLNDVEFKKAVMNVVALEVLEKYNVSTTNPKKVSNEIAKKISEDFKNEWQATKEAFGWD